jgi:hypothetical protein
MADRIVLQNHFKPTKYTLTLEPDLVKFVFGGKLDLHLTVTGSCTTFQLHSRELSVSSASFSSSGAKDATAKSISYDLASSIVFIVFDAPVNIGDGVLHITYTGQLNNQLAGKLKFYFQIIEHIQDSTAAHTLTLVA